MIGRVRPPVRLQFRLVTVFEPTDRRREFNFKVRGSAKCACYTVASCGRVSAGLMPTEARGNYLPEPPYLRETKTYHSQPLESIRHAGNYFVPISIRPIFYFLLQKLCQIT